VPNDVGKPDATRQAQRRSRLAAVIVIGVVVVDQVTKAWAVHDLADHQVVIIGDTVDFRLARNTGSAFSLFQAFTPILAVLAIAVAFFLIRALRRTRDMVMLVALSLILGGAIANLIDRALRAPGFLRGAVVDFVHLGAWPTFNVADASITIGAVLLVFWAIRTDLRAREDAHAEPD
jgi:signal peptidase II